MCFVPTILTAWFIVLPEGPDAIVGKELGGSYYENAAPVIEKQVARAGYRMAAWLDHIARRFIKEQSGEVVPDLAEVIGEL